MIPTQRTSDFSRRTPQCLRVPRRRVTHGLFGGRTIHAFARACPDNSRGRQPWVRYFRVNERFRSLPDDLRLHGRCHCCHCSQTGPGREALAQIASVATPATLLRSDPNLNVSALIIFQTPSAPRPRNG